MLLTAFWAFCTAGWTWNGPAPCDFCCYNTGCRFSFPIVWLRSVLSKCPSFFSLASSFSYHLLNLALSIFSLCSAFFSLAMRVSYSWTFFSSSVFFFEIAAFVSFICSFFPSRTSAYAIRPFLIPAFCDFWSNSRSCWDSTDPASRFALDSFRR